MQKPPKSAEQFLLFFLREELAEEVLGDLEEKFDTMCEQHSLQRARRNYWFQVLNYLRPFAIKNLHVPSTPTTMLRHNFLIGFRILAKNKFLSAINIGGLALGMTVAMLMGLWIYDEFTYNQNHDNYERIVQVLRKDTNDGVIAVNSSHASMLGVKLQEAYASYFEQVSMTFYRPSPLLLKVDRNAIEEMGYFFQSNIPEILSLEMLAGTRQGLEEGNSIFLSASLAQKLFGDRDPLGETVTLDTSAPFMVTGVYQDLPQNSTFSEVKYLLPMRLIYHAQNPFTWDNYNMKVFAQLREGVELTDASTAIKDVLNEELELEAPRDLLLLPMKDWHLNAYFKDGVQTTSSKMKFIWLYGAIGLLVLLIACINFMNLNTARYQTRGKEVGIRKTIGSLRSSLVLQFLIESLLYALAALVISLLLVQLILPWFNSFTDKALELPWDNPKFWLISLGFTVLSALLAGSYPAVFLSSFSTLHALKGTLRQGKGNMRFRQGLVVFQFTVSMLLIMGTLVVYQQIQYAKDRPLGYNQDKLITLVGRSDAYYEKHDLLRTTLKQTGVVEEVAQANYPLTNTLGNNGGFSIERTGRKIERTFNIVYATPEYGATTQWDLLAGRDFSSDQDESSSIIVSKSAAEALGLSDPVGQQLLSSVDYNGQRHFTIIGVVNDMVKKSPFEPTMPLMVFAVDEAHRHLFIRIKAEADLASALLKVQKAYEAVLPTEGFNYQFVDDEYLTKFKSEEQIGGLATFFSILAILINCLGLFGLSAFVMNQRVKEIGIRKVLGASVANLWALLSKDFGLLVLVSSVIATPLAAYLLSHWLDTYQYRVELAWWVFAVGGLVCVIITLITVSYHSLKVSLANPVESLRDE